MEINNIFNSDALEYMKTLKDNSVDLIFTDPPYALGSEVIILPNGKPEYSKAVDFMTNKWEQPNGEFWEAWFKEAKRVLKFGGHCLVFGLDRQLMLYKYFACFAGFTEKQSLYWYFISNFPKSSDLSKNLDKNAGAEREVVGVDKTKQRPNADISRAKDTSHNKGLLGNGGEITAPTTDLAKKYNGMKYSIAPLKQTNETIMVFQKPYKTGSCLHDVIAMENGDDTITCGALDIENNRIETSGGIQVRKGKDSHQNKFKSNSFIESKTRPLDYWDNSAGRFPSQTFIDSNTKEILDGQSGIDNRKDQRLFKNKGIVAGKETIYESGFKPIVSTNYNDAAGCSKSVHLCDYEKGDYDIYVYSPKVSNEERNRGLSGMPKIKDGRYAQDEWSRQNMGNTPDNERQGNENNHPTVKPLKLLQRILKYFKTPNKQIVLDSFVGSGSIPIAAINEGYDYIGTELNADYYEIAQKRIFEAQRQTKLF